MRDRAWSTARRPRVGTLVLTGSLCLTAAALASQDRQEAAASVEIRVLEGGARVPNAWSQASKGRDHSGLVTTDSAGRLRWSVEPGRWRFKTICPSERRWLNRRYLVDLELDVRPGLDTALVVEKPADFCYEPPVTSREDVFGGSFTHGFESSSFVPDEPFEDLRGTIYEGSPMRAWVRFTEEGLRDLGRRLEGPERADEPYPCYRVRWRGELIGPGGYGHLGSATYELTVSEVLSARRVECEPIEGESDRALRAAPALVPGAKPRRMTRSP